MTSITQPAVAKAAPAELEIGMRVLNKAKLIPPANAIGRQLRKTAGADEVLAMFFA
jgi:hypothetical protein